jgi:mannose-6-phosphate isomerase-like protein (cupin superfamily)
MRLRITDMPVTTKPWGGETLIALTPAYAFKRIVMHAGTRCSLQSHVHKLESIYVVSGEIELETVDQNGATHRELYVAGAGYTVPPGTRHRVRVVSDAVLFEVSTPELDDVVRHADDYNRAAP